MFPLFFNPNYQKEESFQLSKMKSAFGARCPLERKSWELWSPIYLSASSSEPSKSIIVSF